MQIVSLEENLHEILKTDFCEKIKQKYFKMTSAEF